MHCVDTASLSGDVMTDFREYLEESLRDPEFKEEWDALAPNYDIINAMIRSGLSTDELSAKSGIARRYIRSIEYANANPSLETLKRLAASMGARLRLEFVPIKSGE